MITIFLFLPLVLRKKVYVLGIGFYKNTNIVISTITKLLLKRVSLVTVRDTYSYAHLLSSGNKVNLFKDNSFLMELLPLEEVVKDTFFQTRFSKARYNVGIGVKKTQTKYDTTKLLSALSKLIQDNATD